MLLGKCFHHQLGRKTFSNNFTKEYGGNDIVAIIYLNETQLKISTFFSKLALEFLHFGYHSISFL